MDKAFEILIQQVRDKRQQIVEAVSTNCAKDYSEYQRLCGTIQGLVFARELINDLAKRLETNDDE